MLNEKGLVAMMKDAWRGNGYTVGLFETHVLIRGEDWAALTPKPLLPRKALALIVEHIGLVPSSEAYCCSKAKGAQTVIMETVREDALRLHMWSKAAKVQAGLCPLTLHGLSVWQEPEGLTVRLVNPENLRLQARYWEKAVTAAAPDAPIVWSGDEGIVVVRTEAPERFSEERSWLDGRAWCGEKKER